MTALTLPPELRRRAGSGALAHAYILSGPAAATWALGRSLAAALVCDGPGDDRPCGTCKHCRKVLGGIHPDVIALAPEDGKDFTVAQARALRTDAYVTPNEAERKVYLVRDAQRMNQPAQNALLKVLEEGPPYAAFLLLTDNPAGLLPTIRSRCELLRAETAAEDDPGGPEAQAKALAQVLLGGDRWAVLQTCVPLEKGKREETAALWEALRKELTRTAGGPGGRKAAQLAQGLGEMLVQSKQNVNLGALWGKLYALAGAP